MPHSFRRTARLLTLAALALCLAAPAATQARSGSATSPAAATPVLELSIGTPCLDGDGFAANDTVRLVHGRDFKTLTDVTFKATGSHFRRCLAKPVQVGDLVRFVRKVGTKVKQQRTITVPDLRITADVETNTLTVDATIAGIKLADYVQIGATGTIAGMQTGGSGTVAILDGAGHAAVNMEDYFFTLRFGDMAYTSYATPDDDTIYRRWAPATLIAQVGKAGVTGSGKPGSTQKLTLKAAGGATRATATAKAGLKLVAGLDANESSAWYATTFTKDGAAVPAKAGNRVVSSVLDPAGATLLPNDFQATAGEGDATLTGTCRLDSRVAVGNGTYAEWAFDTSSGAISRSDLTLASGERIVIGCQAPDGYGQRFTITVP